MSDTVKRHAWTTSTYVPGIGIIEVKDDLIEDISQVIVRLAPPAVKLSDLPELIGAHDRTDG